MEKEEKIKKLALLKNKALELKKDVDYYSALEKALKLVLNGSYGAFATPYFILFNNNVASTITSQGRELTKTMDIDNQDYWYNQWHLDEELHKKLGITDVKKIDKTLATSIYADTDSVSADTIIQTDNGKIKISDWYNSQSESAGDTQLGHQSVKTRDLILNWNNIKERLEFVRVKRIIRHKVSKSKWTLKSTGGKSIDITDCHSLIVFRNGIKIKVKPSDVDIKSDKILIGYI
jgi:DNA polymerase elongation subunit (family B)